MKPKTIRISLLVIVMTGIFFYVTPVLAISVTSISFIFFIIMTLTAKKVDNERSDQD